MSVQAATALEARVAVDLAPQMGCAGGVHGFFGVGLRGAEIAEPAECFGDLGFDEARLDV